MNEFNLQKFVKKSKDEYYTKLYESKTDHSMDEEVEHEDVKEGINGDRIEGLLNIELKNNFLAAGHAVITDFLEDERMDVGEIVSHLANELEKRVAYGAPEEEETLEEISMNATEMETAIALISGVLGLPAVAVMSQKAQDAWKAHKAKGGDKAALKEEEGDEEVVVEDEIEVEDEVSMEAPIEDEVSMEAPEDEAEDSKEIFAKLVDAYESAKKLGDEKLTRQLANTITYFNKSVIFGDS